MKPPAGMPPVKVPGAGGGEEEEKLPNTPPVVEAVLLGLDRLEAAPEAEGAKAPPPLSPAPLPPLAVALAALRVSRAVAGL